MPVYGRKNFSRSNIVRNLPNLPYPLFNGKINWSHSYNPENKKGTVSGSIEYTGLTKKAIDELESAYPERLAVNLGGIDLEVGSFGYQRESFVYDASQRISLYRATISLRQRKEVNKRETIASLKAKRPQLSDAVLWEFSAQEIITDGENSLAANDNGYNGAELSWGDEDDGTGQELVLSPQPPQKDTLIESSPNPKVPPENTKVLRDTTSTGDESGPKKVYRETVRINGTPETEKLYTYAFLYLMEDIHRGDGILYNNQPAQFWKEFEFRNTRHIYQKAMDSVTFFLRPTENSTGRVVLAVHPDFRAIASGGGNEGGGSVTIKVNASYLTEIITTGWDMVRLTKETEGRNSLYPEDPYYPLFQYRKIPFYSRTKYVLKSKGGRGQAVQPPFSIEYLNYEELEPRIRSSIGLFATQATNDTPKVGLIIPNLDFVPPLYVAVEATGSNSFAWAFDPDGEADPDKYIPGTNVVAPRPRFTTGQESRNETERKQIIDGYYSERVSEYASQDPQFDNSIERVVFRTIKGEQPQATFRTTRTEKNIRTNEGRGGRNKRYLVTTPENSRFIEKGGSVNIPEAGSLGEALTLLKRQLAESNMQNSQSNKTVTWYYPDMRGGDVVRTESDRFANRGGLWRVASVSWSLEYQGANNVVGSPLVTTPGTSLTLGLYKEPEVQVSSEETEDGNPDFSVFLREEVATLGTLLPELPNRRNF